MLAVQAWAGAGAGVVALSHWLPSYVSCTTTICEGLRETLPSIHTQLGQLSREEIYFKKLNDFNIAPASSRSWQEYWYLQRQYCGCCGHLCAVAVVYVAAVCDIVRGGHGAEWDHNGSFYSLPSLLLLRITRGGHTHIIHTNIVSSQDAKISTNTI